MNRSWTFGQRLSLGFGVVVVLALSMNGVAVYTMARVTEAKDRVIQHTGQNLIDAERLRGAMQRELANTRGYLLTGDAAYVGTMREANDEFANVLTQIRARDVSTEDASRLDAIEAAEEAHQREVDAIIEQRRTGTDPALAATTYDRRVGPRFDELEARVRAYVADSEREREAGRQRASADAIEARNLLIGFGAGTTVIALLMAIFLTRALSRQVGTSVHQIRGSSTELQAAASQQASAAKQQATAMHEITTTISELLATSRQIAESGQHVAKMASESAESARVGGVAVEKARESVDSIQSQVATIVQHMLELGRKSQQIGAILDLINELSEQTNILAINATIEAASAGDAGRRFAVVGDEIRKLADRTGASTKEIRTLIEDVRAAVNSTVMATETGSKTVDAGTRRFEELETSFTRIGEIVVTTMQAGREIELSTKQQSTAVEQVNQAIANVAQASQETETSSRQTLETASMLTTLSNELMRLVQSQAG